MNTWLLKATAVLSIFAAAGIAYGAEPAIEATPATIPATTAPASTNGIGPKIQFDSATYDFGRIRAGTKVRHDFMFTNTGDATLKVTGVNPGCHCTTVGDWTHEVEPGKTGVIPIQFDSTGFGGPIVRTPAVTCNDKSQPVVRVQLHGTISKPVDFSPAFVSMNIGPDASEETNAVVHIVNNEAEPLVLGTPTSTLPSFAAELKTITPGKNYDLIIRTVPPLASGPTQARITVGVLSTNGQPPLSIFAMANVQPLVSMNPPQFTLPAGPLASNETFSVVVRSQSSHPLVLSDPSVNADGAKPTISVSKPGHDFIASVEFSAGFQAKPGVPVELSIKTDNARFPVVTIPIRQAPRAAALPPHPDRMKQ